MSCDGDRLNAEVITRSSRVGKPAPNNVSTISQVGGNREAEPMSLARRSMLQRLRCTVAPSPSTDVAFFSVRLLRQYSVYGSSLRVAK